MHAREQAHQIEQLKAAGRFRHAGQLAALIGYRNDYGCHFGMRGTREIAMSEFRDGWSEIDELFRISDR